MSRIVIIMASNGDLEWCNKIAEGARMLGVPFEMRIASAHKVPLRCLEIIKENEGPGVVFITVAGRSNALSGFSDAQTYCPVLACPPYSDKYGGGDVFSSLNMPSGVAPLTVVDPMNAAFAAAKILAVGDPKLAARVREFQEQHRDRLISADSEVRGDG